jgi:hypothetical protein
MADQHTTELLPQQEQSRQTQPTNQTKSNKIKSHHVQPKDTHIKLMVTNITKITRGNYNRRKEDPITVNNRNLT